MTKRGKLAHSYHLFVLILLAAISLGLFILIRNDSRPKKDKSIIYISAESSFVDDEQEKIIMKILDQERQQVKYAFITVYEQESPIPIYDFSSLRTDRQGKVEFTLAPGVYEVFVSTGGSAEEQYIQPSKFPFFLHFTANVIQGDYHTDYQFETRKVRLELINLPFSIPDMKVEVTKKMPWGFTLSQMVQVAKQADGFDFYISDGEYNINLDPEEFSSKEPRTFALARMNVAIPDTKLISFDYNSLNKFSVNMEGVKTGWFKLIGDDTGDFQGMYFGRPVTVFTNMDKLKLMSVYTPLESCIDYLNNVFDDKNRLDDSPVYILAKCTTAEMRYDFFNTDITPAGSVTILPPAQLKILPTRTSLPQGEDFEVNYQVLNEQGNHIQNIYIHQLWDSRVLPQFFFYDTAGKLVYETDLFDENYFPGTYPVLKRKICLKPGTYKVEARLPTGNWNNKTLEASTSIEVTSGQECQLQEDQNFKYTFKTWQDFYASRGEVFRKSTGYLLTLPRSPRKKINPVSLKEESISTINSCDDLKQASFSQIIIVNLTKENVFNIDSQQRFSECLGTFSSGHPEMIYILNNSFFDFMEQPFPSFTMFAMYHFYSVLQKSTDSRIGVQVNQFYELFYGFPDFYVVNKLSSLGFPIEPLEIEEILPVWLEHYQSIFDTQVVYSNLSIDQIHEKNQ